MCTSLQDDKNNQYNISVPSVFTGDDSREI